MQESDYIIRVEHVSKSFGDKTVLNDVNLYVRKGEFVTILGPSGCGKTTLLRLIAGFQTANEGGIAIAGEDITQTPPHKRPVNTVFQKYALFPHLNMYNNITFVYVTHDQEEALTLSDTIVVMSEGKIQQIGTPTDIYNEPVNSFVADFIGESNILNGIMVKDKVVRFAGHTFDCVDEGFGEMAPVDVVLRPEDIYIFDLSDAAMLRGIVTSCIFKGVHYEMTVQTPEGYEFVVQDYHMFPVDAEVGLRIKPFDIHVMKKERVCNTFEGKMIDSTHVEFLGCPFECKEQAITAGESVTVEVDFDKVSLEDNEEDGTLTGEVKFILYKGNHYHLTVLSDWDEDIFVDTNDVWDDGDRVGIRIAPGDIRIYSPLKREGSVG